jgi:hypothetical protein
MEVQMKPAVAFALSVLTGVAFPAASTRPPGPPVARIHIDPTEPRTAHLLVYGSGKIAIAVGAGTLRPRRDTLHVSTPTNITVDLTDGELHIVGIDDQDIRLDATLHDAPAVRLSAVGRHLVMERGGAGVRTQP